MSVLIYRMQSLSILLVFNLNQGYFELQFFIGDNLLRLLSRMQTAGNELFHYFLRLQALQHLITFIQFDFIEF